MADILYMIKRIYRVYGGLCIGAVGSVCSTANMFPELVCGIYNKYVEGDYKGSLEDQFTLNPVRLSQDKAIFPVATKDMAKLMGLDVGEPVLPNKSSKGAVLDNMKNEMIKAGLLG